MAHKIEALTKGGRVYTLMSAAPDPITGRRDFKYIGLRDGWRWRAFKSKKEWAAAVDMEPDFFPLTPVVSQQQRDAMDAQFLSEYAGDRLLGELSRAIARQRRAGPPAE